MRETTNSELDKLREKYFASWKGSLTSKRGKKKYDKVRKAYYEAQSRSYYNKNKTYSKLYNRSYHSKHYKPHPRVLLTDLEKVANRKKYYQTHQQEIVAKSKKWYQIHRQEVLKWHSERCKLEVKKMSDRYIASLLGWNVKDVPEVILEVKRSKLLLYRAIVAKEKHNEEVARDHDRTTLRPSRNLRADQPRQHRTRGRQGKGQHRRQDRQVCVGAVAVRQAAA